jgi:hypothetical protein
MPPQSGVTGLVFHLPLRCAPGDDSFPELQPAATRDGGPEQAVVS